MLLGIQDPLDLAAKRTQPGEEPHIVRGRADSILLSLKHEQRGLNLCDVTEWRARPERLHALLRERIIEARSARVVEAEVALGRSGAGPISASRVESGLQRNALTPCAIVASWRGSHQRCS